MQQDTLPGLVLIQNALAATTLSRKITNHLSVHGISLSEFLVMYFLDKAPQKALSRIMLAEQVSMSASGVTRLLAPMEKNHLVEKQANPRDARQSLVKLSDTGLQVYTDARESFNHIASDLTGKLSDTQLSRLSELLNMLV